MAGSRTDHDAVFRDLVDNLGIDLDCRLAPGPWPVRADGEEIRRLVPAFASNAADAMPGGGTLTISTASVAYDGLDARRQSGLATGYGIVTRAGGQIRIESAPGRGTAVECALPRAERPVPAATDVPAAATGGPDTVLVAEDEPMVREIVAGILRGLGYAVLEAGDGVEALAAAAGAPPLALLVTDVEMPRMDGRELAERLRRQHPGLRTLFVSGYTDGALVVADDAATAFLPKPFMADELADAVRGLI